jgi:phosphocarrier protein HPr
LSETATRRVVVISRHGLHVRPCLAIVNTVNRHQANVTVQKGSQAVDATNMMGLISLGAPQGTELVLSATGPQAEAALDALAGLFASQFGVEYNE